MLPLFPGPLLCDLRAPGDLQNQNALYNRLLQKMVSSQSNRNTGMPKRLHTHDENVRDGELFSKFECEQRRQLWFLFAWAQSGVVVGGKPQWRNLSPSCRCLSPLCVHLFPEPQNRALTLAYNVLLSPTISDRWNGTYTQPSTFPLAVFVVPGF